MTFFFYKNVYFHPFVLQTRIPYHPLNNPCLVIRKPINAIPRSKINREFNFSIIKVLFLLMFRED